MEALLDGSRIPHYFETKAAEARRVGERSDGRVLGGWPSVEAKIQMQGLELRK